jgi:thiol:disulfide interchange protein DsbD
VQAQILHPVKWSYGFKKLSTTEAVVMLKADIEPGWHIYNTAQADGGPVKTSFVFLPSSEYSLTGSISEPSPITKYEKAFEMNVSYFENSVIFRQVVSLNKASTIIKGTLRFMVCNDKQCLLPDWTLIPGIIK